MTALDKSLQTLRERRSSIYLIDGATARSYTYGDLAALAGALSIRLAETGVRRGDRVAVVLPNSPDFVFTYFATFWLGATVVPLNPQAHPRDIRSIAGRTRPAAIVCSEANRGLVDSTGSKLLILKLPGDAGAGIAIEDLRDGPPGTPSPDASPEDVWSITHTSGTTAEPKGVMHSFENLLGNASSFNRFAGVDHRSRFYHVLPMYYIAGFLNSLLCPFTAGGSVVLGREFNPTSALDFWSTPVRDNVNAMWLPPTVLAMLNRIDRDRRAPEFARSQIEHLLVATAPLPVQVKREFEKKYGVVARQSYGTSEQLFITLNDPASGDREDAVGRPIEGVALKVVGSDGRESPPGAEGEVMVSSRFNFLGYFSPGAGSPGRTEQDWESTGDLGMCADRGELVITGRKKDLIIKGGMNISPAAVESAVRTNPIVEDCVVVGVPHEVYGEVVAVAVRTAGKGDFRSTVDSIRATCRAELSPAQQPTYLLEFLQFPVTPTGKIQRARVRDEVISRLDEAVILR